LFEEKKVEEKKVEAKKTIKRIEKRSESHYAEMSLSEYYEKVFEQTRAKRVSKETWRREQGYWRRILSYLGHFKITELDGAVWSDYLDTMDSGNYKRLNQAAYNELLKNALHRGVISKIHSFEVIKGSSTPVREVTPLSESEIERLLNHAGSPMHRALFACSIGNGLRPREACRVRWEDVNYQDNKFRVRGTKTKLADSVVPLTAFTKRELLRYWELLDRPSEGLAFKWHNKEFATFDRALKAAALRANIDPSKRIHPNMLRHTFATLAALNGVPLPVTQHILRHSSPRMLLEVYAKAGRLNVHQGLDKFPL